MYSTVFFQLKLKIKNNIIPFSTEMHVCFFFNAKLVKPKKCNIL